MAQFDPEETHLQLRAWLKETPSLLVNRVWENSFDQTTGKPYQPKPDTPYFSEQFAPQTSSAAGIAPKLLMVDRGLYIVTWFGITGVGDSEIHQGVKAILGVFPARRTVHLPSGNQLRVRGDVAPYCGQVTPIDGGHSYCQITVPWAVEWFQS